MSECKKCDNREGQVNNLKLKVHNLHKRVNDYERKFSMCWLCGDKKDLTNHHFQGKKGRDEDLGTMPLCRKHHNWIEAIKTVISHFEKARTLTHIQFKAMIIAVKRLI